MVTGLWDHMSDHYGTRLARKDAPEMQLAATALEEMGILDAEDFLRRFTTTLGRTIYTPYEIGVGDERKLASQLRTCVHEHQHVVQYYRGGVRFAFEYATDTARRAHYEADAHRCSLELHYWMYGKVQNVRRVAETLVDYGCTGADIDVCEKALLMTAKVVEQGGVSSDAGKVAVEWLNQHVA
jgi:hypothetical protein